METSFQFLMNIFLFSDLIKIGDFKGLIINEEDF